MTRSTRPGLAGYHKARAGAMARGQGSAGHDENERAYQTARDGKVEGVISKSGRPCYPLPLRERVVSSVSEKPGEGFFQR